MGCLLAEPQLDAFLPRTLNYLMMVEEGINERSMVLCKKGGPL